MQIRWHIAYNTNVIYLQVLATKVILLFQILLIVQAVESGIVDLVCFLVQSREWWVLAFLSFGHCLRRHLVEFQVLCQHDRRPFQGSVTRKLRYAKLFEKKIYNACFFRVENSGNSIRGHIYTDNINRSRGDLGPF